MLNRRCLYVPKHADLEHSQPEYTHIWVYIYLSPSPGLRPSPESAPCDRLRVERQVRVREWRLLGVSLRKARMGGSHHGPVAGASPAADGAIVPSSEVAVFALSNDGSALPERTVSFGQIFRPGTVGKQDQLQAVIGGVPVPTQIDAKAFNNDGSVRHAIVSDAVAAPERRDNASSARLSAVHRPPLSRASSHPFRRSTSSSH